MNRFLPSHLPELKSLWLNGILVRAATQHLTFGAATLFEGVFWLFAVWVIVTETAAFLLYARVRGGAGPFATWGLIWLGVSDAQFFLGALFLARASGTAPPVIYALIVAVWACSLAGSHYVAYAAPLPKRLERDTITTTLDKAADTLPAIKRIFRLSLCLGLGWAGTALVAGMFFYAMDQNSYVALAISAMWLGLAVAFSRQSAGVMMGFRARKAQWD